MDTLLKERLLGKKVIIWGSRIVGIGFKRGLGSPCVFYHQGRQLRAVIHGDDFTILGYARDLDWFRNEIKARYEIKCKARLGPEVGDDKEVRILNRVVHWDSEGIKYEPDQRHAVVTINGCSSNILDMSCSEN